MEFNTALIIDDDRDIVNSAVGFLYSDLNFTKVFWSVSAADADKAVKDHEPQLVIADLGTPGLSASDFPFNQDSGKPFLLITSYYDNEDYIKLSREMGGYAFCLKEHLNEAVSQLIRYLVQGSSAPFFDTKFYLLKR